MTEAKFIPLLPCDFRIGPITFKKGTPVHLAEAKAQKHHDQLLEYAAAGRKRATSINDHLSELDAWGRTKAGES